MKKLLLSLSIIAGLALTSCTGPDNDSKPVPSDMPGPTVSSSPAPSPSIELPEGVRALEPAEMDKYLTSPRDVIMQAVLVDEDTVYLQLTGSSSCPAIPETITADNGNLIVNIKEWKGNCTADLGTSDWEVTLPKELVPQTEPLNVLVYSGSVDPSVILAEPINESSQDQQA